MTDTDESVWPSYHVAKIMVQFDDAIQAAKTTQDRINTQLIFGDFLEENGLDGIAKHYRDKAVATQHWHDQRDCIHDFLVGMLDIGHGILSYPYLRCHIHGNSPKITFEGSPCFAMPLSVAAIASRIPWSECTWSGQIVTRYQDLISSRIALSAHKEFSMHMELTHYLMRAVIHVKDPDYFCEAINLLLYTFIDALSGRNSPWQPTIAMNHSFGIPGSYRDYRANWVPPWSQLPPVPILSLDYFHPPAYPKVNS